MVFFFCVAFFGAYARHDSLLIKNSAEFHQKLIANDASLSNYLDKNLSYGHSNGWLETKEELLQNLATGKMKYIEIKEDSVTTSADKEIANVRFKSTINAVLNGNQLTVNLRVLEVWRNKNGKWLLFARQAVRVN